MGLFSFFIRRFLFRLDERLRLVLIAAVVGICGGLASVSLNLGLQYISAALRPMRTNWYALIFPACGAAVAVFFLRGLIRDFGGHGVPEVIYSISMRGGLLRLRSSFSRLISCMLTISSGGSAGPEAPVVISGASIGSNIAGFFYLNDRQRIVIVACGAAAAIASIFNAPATGIVFALEAILGEWTPVNLVPIAIASVVGTEVSRLLQGNQIPFEHRFFNVSSWDLISCLGLAVLTGLSAVLLMRMIRVTTRVSGKALKYPWLRAAAGGLLVGGLGLFLPDVLGEGYEYIRSVIEEQYPPGLALAGLSGLTKIVATSFTLGSGGSGGIFAPCLVIGSFIGLFFQRALILIFPSVAWAGEGYFGLLGMAGVISSVLQAPLTGIFLIMEITGGYDVMVSVVLVAVMSATLSHFWEPFSIYHGELVARGELLRPRTDARILSELSVMELLEKDCRVIRPDMKLKDFVRVVERSHRNYFPVEDPESGRFLGMVYMDDIRPYLFDSALYESVVVEEIMNRDINVVSPDDELPDVLRRFDETHSWSLPVVQAGRFEGLISKATLLDYYRRELMAQEEQ